MTFKQHITYLERMKAKEQVQIAALQRSIDRYKLQQFERAYGILSIN